MGDTHSFASMASLPFVLCVVGPLLAAGEQQPEREASSSPGSANADALPRVTVPSIKLFVTGFYLLVFINDSN